MNIDAMINSLHREQISRAEFRAKAGFVDTQELRTLNGKKRGFFAGLLAGEIDRVQRAQGFKVPKAAIPADFAEEMDEVEDLEKLTETAVPLAPVAEKNAAQLQEEALKIFENEEEVDDNGDMSLRWERFCTALKAAVDSTGVEHDALIAMSMDGSEIGIGRMHGVKPYLCFNRPDDSASLENFRDYFLEGTMYDPPFSRIGAIIVGLDHNHLLYVLLEFLEENTEQAKFTLTFDSDWDKPTVLYLESDIDGGQAKPYDARKAL
jgi:hypothetical protein